ncbi:hypothetical protein AVEN_232684-1 [Araneus ventricosus]|uniref:Uncharacterized protein n=1 Tax=Araneus ventricosus TaxID=182803 RepID=A0A4Y2HE13_ARAVE|nr:hypothetical protein AVEN_232684-1 [Araneus ventricosus]
MRGQIAQAANTHMMKIGTNVDCKEWWHEKCSSYEGSEHLYATTAKFSGCVLLDSRPAYSYPPRWKKGGGIKMIFRGSGWAWCGEKKWSMDNWWRNGVDHPLPYIPQQSDSLMR